MKRDPYAALRPQMNGAPTHWRSIEHKDGEASFVESIDREFPAGTEPMSAVSRRRALQLSGASMALGMLSACMDGKLQLRRPEEKLVPFVKNPENIIPGIRMYYATALQRSSGAVGLLVEAHDGRPTKLEGNPRHPSSLGATDTWIQAEVLRVYDPERARAPKQGTQDATWDAWDAAAAGLAKAFAANNGKGLAVLTEVVNGPTHERLLAELVAKYPEAKVHRFDRLAPVAQIAGSELAFGPGARAHVDLDPVRAVFALESDFLFSGPDHLRHAKLFGHSRAVSTKDDVAKMKRLYVAEAAFSGTGTNADHRLRWSNGEAHGLLLAVAKQLVEKHGLSLPAELTAALAGAAALPGDSAKFVEALAKDLAAERGKGLVLVGETQPAAVHALAHAINVGLGALETKALTLTTGAPLAGLGLDGLVADLNAGTVETLVMLETNPVYTADGALEFGKALKKAKTSVHVGLAPDETAAEATWHLPSAHFLESWGDAAAWSGLATVIQPTILPLHGGRPAITIVAQLLGLEKTADRALVEATWRGEGMPLADANAWRKALHEGVVDTARAPIAEVVLAGAAIAEALGKVQAKKPSADAVEVIAAYGHVRDGRLTNVSWVMELPDSVTKLCWDNAALVSPKLASALGIKSGVQRNGYTADIITLTVDGRTVEAPAFVLPGLAEHTVVVNAGYGRKLGDVANCIGSNVYPLLGGGHVAHGVSVKRTGATQQLCSTQDHFAVPGNPLKELTFAEMSAAAEGAKERKLGLDPRPLFRAGTAKEYVTDGGKLAEKGNMPENLFEKDRGPKNRPARGLQPTNEITYAGQQWGMVIDLSACNGCNACAVACVAENNIPAVGREQVLLGREMHWIRIDRYFAGDVDQPQALHQPVACMHCENAPCEPVCPVSATVHDEEGMNSMAYNRCIGTRYCANNCPYKVRRFNYLDYTHTGVAYVEPMWKQRMKTLKLQRNPDVTVRYRGVMEKCTYCTQRVEEAKVMAKREGRDRKGLPDGAVTPACAQACPTDAITFGNINDPKSRVFALKQGDRNYEMLQELNVRPRTTYLARIRNSNEELA
jgi:MoCo/4Fe-4S cofactor protein with predicted Tat translocation signal